MTLRSSSQIFFFVKSLQCQLLQSLWLIWIMFGMNGYKTLKCFRKEQSVSGKLPCPATGLVFLLCISELLWLCRVVALKSLPVHSFNALIIPILRGCLQSLFNIPVPWYLFDTVLKVTSWPAFVSRCIIDAYFSFYGLVLDIDMNCGCRLYRSFWQMDLTYAMDCLLNSITGMNVAFLLTVSPPYTQLWLSQTD